jgi:hypothetical protein
MWTLAAQRGLVIQLSHEVAERSEGGWRRLDHEGAVVTDRLDLIERIDAVGCASILQGAAIVGALCEGGLVDPAAVIRWVDRVLENEVALTPKATQMVAAQLKFFTEALRAIPDSAGVSHAQNAASKRAQFQLVPGGLG